jgi:ribosomal protein S12 methylthiotransferase
MLKKQKFSLISLGCAKNLVDSEEIIGSLIRKGYQLEQEVKNSELVIINTCAFLHEARLEALSTIKEMAEIKNSGKSKLQKIVVVGCFVQYFDKQKIKELVPEVDLIVPIKDYGKIPFLLEKKETVGCNGLENSLMQKNRFLSRSPHSVYIKIAEGCNNRCSYCLIPFLRGELRSKKIEDILSEVKAVRKLGAREINLIAQDTTAYGLDLYGKLMLGELLQSLCKLEGIEWIRILYTHPAHITDDLLEVIQKEPRICKYIDIPIQHISNKILKLMGRKTSKEDIISLYTKIRELVPGVVMRTTVMVGFPGEGEHEFAELLTFLRQHPFERVGAFVFSRERKTTAYKLPGRVSTETARQRLNQIMKQQKGISRNFNRILLGREVKVLVDFYDRIKNRAYGRIASQAPEVDGRVIITRVPGVRPGDLINVKITGTGSYDLIGENIADEYG